MRFDELGTEFYLKLFTKFVEFQHHNLEPAGYKATNFKVSNSFEQGSRGGMKRNSLREVNLVELFSYISFIEKPESG